LLSANPPLIIAHRGSSALAPENTLAAFGRAFDDGADGIELDVRLTSDGVPVVIHDATLQRTAGNRGLIRKITSAQLAETEVGSWFNHAQPGFARQDYAHECVPTLERVFQLVIDRGQAKCTMYVELKTDGKEPELARAVVELVKRFHFQDRVVVVSFDLGSLRQVKLLTSSMRTGGLFAPRHGGGTGLRAERIVSMATGAGANELLLNRLIARPKLVRLAQTRGLAVVVWTVDDANWLERGADLGVHALITNNPSLFLAHRSLPAREVEPHRQ
jgi:glycerophosphoryl diester phosphodiesterase